MKNNTVKIGANEVLKETELLLEAVARDRENLNQNQVENILKEMLKCIQPVNFREYCKLEGEKEKLQKKHFLVACIELLLKIVNLNEFSLCRKNELIYLFNSEYWENVKEEDFKDFLGDVALKMGIDKFDAKHHLFKDELYKQFIADAGLKEIKPNNKTTLINLKNGTFEITPKKQFLRPFRKSDFLTHQLPFAYDRNAKFPLFQKFLDEVLPEPELQKILAEYLGYIFIKNGVLKLEKVLLLFGTGANGKSVVFEVLMALLGPQNVTNYSLQSLTSENGNSRAMIENKLLNYASEINGKMESSIFKILISGEPVEARLLYKNTQTITDYARFMFNCNELPREIENTNAFFRRFLILPFRITIPQNKQDKDLSGRIIETELSGVFNWVLNGLTTLLENKSFTHSKIVQNEVLQYQKESDSVLMFLDDENYQRSLEQYKPLKDIYSKYKCYCLESSFRPCSIQTFSKRLKKNNFAFNRKSYGYAVFIERKILNTSEVNIDDVEF